MQTKLPIRDTPIRTPTNFVQGGSSIPVAQSTPTSQSSIKSDHTISSLRSINIISLREIYEDIEVHSNFSLLSCRPTYFKEAIKEENWTKAMDK